jgi:hypothetical protein
LAPQLHELIDEWSELAMGLTDGLTDGLADALTDDEADGLAKLERGLLASLMMRLRKHGCKLDDEMCQDLLANDIQLNAQGLMAWRRQAMSK